MMIIPRAKRLLWRETRQGDHEKVSAFPHRIRPTTEDPISPSIRATVGDAEATGGA